MTLPHLLPLYDCLTTNNLIRNILKLTHAYETIGGNHSRIALAQLLNEKKELALDPKFFNRRISVYTRLSDEQAQHLAHRHNRATEFTSKMNTQDKVLHTHACIQDICMHCPVYHIHGNVFSLAYM